MKLAKIRHRIMATILDNIIIFAFIFVCLLGIWIDLIGLFVGDRIIDIDMVISLIGTGMLYSLFLLFYYMVVPIFLNGQTIGKWVFKIKVICDDDREIDYKVLFFREAICRILVRTLSIGLSSIVSFIIMLLRDDKKSLADVFAKTKVIDIKGEF